MYENVSKAKDWLTLMTQFAFTDAEFLELVNKICQRETSLGTEYQPIVTMDEVLNMGRLDSLGMIIFFTWMTDLFGIPEENCDTFVAREVITVQDLKDFVSANCTQTYSYETAAEYMNACL